MASELLGQISKTKARRTCLCARGSCCKDSLSFCENHSPGRFASCKAWSLTLSSGICPLPVENTVPGLHIYICAQVSACIHIVALELRNVLELTHNFNMKDLLSHGADIHAQNKQVLLCSHQHSFAHLLKTVATTNCIYSLALSGHFLFDDCCQPRPS